MTADELHRAATLMQKQGGGFAEAIALAFFRADSRNQEKLVRAFVELFERHHKHD